MTQHRVGRGVALRAAGVGLKIGPREVLVGIDLEALAGRVVVVTGPAGSGKTSLLHVLAGILTPSAGEVTLDGTKLTSYGPNGPTTLGFVPQTFGLAGALSAEENMALPLQLLGLGRNEVATRVAQMLSSLGLESARGQLAGELSGGQQQRTAVGRAIVAEPGLVVADEPTSELDAVSRDLVFDLFRNAADQGATVVVATHDPDLVERCDDVVSLHDGRVVK
ncbi:MAG: ATP-binding cassette domain-containing protein [Acidimicrobiales bacterium]|jgi:putative ABC transport system ATP-binding protein